MLALLRGGRRSGAMLGVAREVARRGKREVKLEVDQEVERGELSWGLNAENCAGGCTEVALEETVEEA
ncbi:hypothetical protein PDENDC454_15767 [Paenibacillus dendritiformis C454]|uniref:Uncharacterized protein n=1 Tax=Paenibacillus dendritiformis C454 TaxID=1131935 RepID=H3SHZ1_9BACL|nr:hypothetical protein PDENDC454_15767 [Paenibacillus dendritiformis C454]